MVRQRRRWNSLLFQPDNWPVQRNVVRAVSRIRRKSELRLQGHSLSVDRWQLCHGPKRRLTWMGMDRIQWRYVSDRLQRRRLMPYRSEWPECGRLLRHCRKPVCRWNATTHQRHTQRPYQSTRCQLRKLYFARGESTCKRRIRRRSGHLLSRNFLC